MEIIFRNPFILAWKQSLIVFELNENQWESVDDIWFCLEKHPESQIRQSPYSSPRAYNLICLDLSIQT